MIDPIDRLPLALKAIYDFVVWFIKRYGLWLLISIGLALVLLHFMDISDFIMYPLK